MDYQLRIFLLSGESFHKIKCIALFFLFPKTSSLRMCQQVVSVGYMPCTDLYKPTERCVAVCDVCPALLKAGLENMLENTAQLL